MSMLETPTITRGAPPWFKQGRTLIVSGVRAVLCTEVFLVLFIYAGQFKTQPLVRALQVDFTVLTGTLTLLFALVALGSKMGRINKRAALACVWLLMFAVVVVIGTVWSPGDKAAEKAYVRFPLVVLSFAVGALLVSAERARVRRVLNAVLATGVYVSVLALNTAATRKTTWGGLAVEGAGDYIDIGMAAAVCSVIVMARLACDRSSLLMRIVLMALWAMFVLTVFIAGSRQALVIMGLVTLVGALLWLKQGSILEKFRKSWVLSVLVGVAVVVVVVAVARGASLSTMTRMDRLQRGRAEESFGERPWLYNQAIGYWYDSPIIGIGTAGYLWDAASVHRRLGAYPHNIFLEVLSENGLLGLVPLVVLMVTCAWQLRRIPMFRETESTAVRLVFVALLASAQVSGSYTQERPLFAFLGILCYVPATIVVRRPSRARMPEAVDAHPAPGA